MRWRGGDNSILFSVWYIFTSFWARSMTALLSWSSVMKVPSWRLVKVRKIKLVLDPEAQKYRCQISACHSVDVSPDETALCGWQDLKNPLTNSRCWCVAESILLPTNSRCWRAESTLPTNSRCWCVAESALPTNSRCWCRAESTLPTNSRCWCRTGSTLLTILSRCWCLAESTLLTLDVDVLLKAHC